MTKSKPTQEDRSEHELAAERHFNDIMERAPWIYEYHIEASKIVNSNSSVRSKLGKFHSLADRLAAEISPSAVCASGCSSCCNISLSMSQSEADRIGQSIGVDPKQLGNQAEAIEPEEATAQYFGVPCPFLKDEACSIYEHRPLACKLHFNIGSTSRFCGIDIAAINSSVPNVNLDAFWLYLASISLNSAHGDIREFFP